MTDAISKVMNRHLTSLKKEVNAYTHADDMWIKAGDIPNSAGNLVLHLCGNLQHFIGAVLGGTGYVRDREAEFNRQHVPVEELNTLIDQTMSVVTSTLLTYAGDLKEEYPEGVFKEPITTEFFLIHLTSHLGYHLGQVNYHRRLIESS